MSAILLFIASFLLVMLLGLQQLNVQGNHRPAAFFTSLLIGAANLAVLKLVPGPTGWLEVAGFLAGGPFGILASMALHPWLMRNALVVVAEPETGERPQRDPGSRPTGDWLTLSAPEASASMRLPNDPLGLEHAMRELEKTVEALRLAGGAR